MIRLLCATFVLVGLPWRAEADGVSVTDFGAVGDGVTLNTAALHKTIDVVSQKGGGHVVFPAPGTYLTGTIFIKDNVILEIPVGATLLGSQHSSDYREDAGSCAYNEDIDLCLIYASNAKNIGLTGRGTISGNGTPPVIISQDGKSKQRPMLVRFEDCDGIEVNQLKVVEAFSWAFHFARCKDVRIHGLSIFNRRQDGIDLESCEDVTISDCSIKAGDDAIVLLTNKGVPTRNVTISNCILQSKWAGVRFGPLSSGDINNITIANCVIRDCRGGGFKIAMLGGGEIRNGTFSNITMEKVVAPILIMLMDWEEIAKKSSKTMPVGKISHLSFSHIVGTSDAYDPKLPDSSSTIFLHGHPEQDLEDISLSDIDLTFVGGGTVEQAAQRNLTDADKMPHEGVWPEHRDWGVPPASALYARHVKGLNLNRVRFTIARPDFRSTVFLNQSSDINIAGFTTKTPSHCAAAHITLLDCQDALITGCQDNRGRACFLALEGAKTFGVSLLGNSLAGFASEVERGPETPEDARQWRPIRRDENGGNRK